MFFLRRAAVNDAAHLCAQQGDWPELLRSPWSWMDGRSQEAKSHATNYVYTYTLLLLLLLF